MDVESAETDAAFYLTDFNFKNSVILEKRGKTFIMLEHIPT